MFQSLEQSINQEIPPVEGNEALIYLLTRNAVNPFEIEVYKGFSMSLEENSAFLIKFATNSLVYLDICSELRSNGLCLEEQLSSYKTCLQKHAFNEEIKF